MSIEIPSYGLIDKKYDHSVPATEVIKAMRDAMGLKRVVAMAGTNEPNCIDVFVGPHEDDVFGGVRVEGYFRLYAVGIKAPRGGCIPEFEHVVSDHYRLEPLSKKAEEVAEKVMQGLESVNPIEKQPKFLSLIGKLRELGKKFKH